jgi:pyridoxine kinase
VIPRVLSIQSWVAHGHVGNSAAVFVLQRLGCEVAAIHTVQFSNHTGYGAWTGAVFGPESIGELVDGLEARGVLAVNAVLSGYMGSVGTVEQVARTVQRVRGLNPAALYCCDPVMGDVGRGVFVRPEIPDLISGFVVPLADVLTPNQFELELLTGQVVDSLEDAIRAVRVLQARMNPLGPRMVLLTSLVRADADVNQLENLVVAGDLAYVIATPKMVLEPPRNGTGDTITALFLAHLLRSQDVRRSLELAVNGLYRLLEITDLAGTREIQLVAAQDEFVSPTSGFVARAVETKQ